MSLNTAGEEFRFAVYVPFVPKTIEIVPIDVPRDASVQDLRKQILRNGALKTHVLVDESLELYKYGQSTPSADRFRTVTTWLRSQTDEDLLDKMFQLTDYFPQGPGRERDAIDIVAVPGFRLFVYVPFDSGAQPFRIDVPRTVTVQDLQTQIHGNKRLRDHLDETLELYKYGQSVSPQDQFRVVTTWLRSRSNQDTLRLAYPIRDYFPQGPVIERDAIDIVAVTESILESPDVLFELPSERIAYRINKDRQAISASLRLLGSPSEGIKNSENIKKWISHDGLHIHRPASNYGPPTFLFHPVLARLKHSLEHLEELDPDSHLLEECHTLIMNVCRVYDKESTREEALRTNLRKLIGHSNFCQEQYSIPGSRIIPDAVWIVCGMIVLIFELKNEDGLMGNASLQSVLDIPHITAQSQYSKVLEHSNCPIILFTLMGTRLEISTAIYINGIYVDKHLSYEMYLDAWQSEHILRLGQIFMAVRNAVNELVEYYSELNERLGGNPPTIRHLFPNPLPVSSTTLPTLEYRGKLSHTGALVEFSDATAEEVNQTQQYATYLAYMRVDDQQVEVVVKFTAQYNEAAHRLLADHGYAPKLHYFSRLVGGLYMVVMEYINSRPLPLIRSDYNRQDVYRDLEKAVQALHDQNFVFGDLRPRNIVLKPQDGMTQPRAMLIDFDWVGEHQVSKYPASWNTDNTFSHHGVCRRGLMDKAHDIHMLQQVKNSLLRA